METAISICDADITRNTFCMNNISLDIKKGFVTAVIGENNSGKTTLMETVAGVHGITRGEIYVQGLSLKEEAREAKQSMGFIFHKCPFEKHLTAEACMKLYGRFYRDFDKESFLSLCREMNVDVKKTIKKMSKGQAVKLQLAFALAHDAKLLLFDDAMEGLDPVFRIELRKRLSDIMADGQHTVVISTKLPEDLENLADYIVTLKNGKIESVADIEQIREKGGIREYFKWR